jgi:hypothetical protein
MGVLVFGGFAAAITVGAFVAKMRCNAKLYIFAAFLLAAMTGTTAVALWSSPWKWEGPAFGDAFMFAVVGFQLLHGIEDPEKPKKQFANLVYGNAFAAILFAVVYAVWRVYHFMTPIWMIWVFLIATRLTGVLVLRAIKKLRHGIEPFGPKPPA